MERKPGLSAPSHGQERSQTVLTSHPNLLQLRIHCPRRPHFKDQQLPLEQLGHHHSNQARPGSGWGGADLKSFVASKHRPDPLILVMFRGPVDWGIQASRDHLLPTMSLNSGKDVSLVSTRSFPTQSGGKFKLSVPPTPTPAPTL